MYSELNERIIMAENSLFDHSHINKSLRCNYENFYAKLSICFSKL